MIRSPLILAALTFGGGLLFAGASRAQVPAARPNVILFVGNSFTHGHYKPVRDYNAAAVTDENAGLPKGNPLGANRTEGAGSYVGIPGIFKRLTDEAGLSYEVHVETVGGKNLEYHYKHALGLIARADWNTVVLQDLSTGPLPEARSAKAAAGSRGEDEAAGKEKHPDGPDPTKKPSLAMAGSFYQHVPLLEKAVHAANPDAKVYLYATWPTALLVYPEGSMYAGEKIDVMGADLHDAYYHASAEDGHIAGVAPVGDAWMRAIHEGIAQENPYHPPEPGKLDLWGADYKHPSPSGAYLAALVLFQEITGKDARALGRNEQAAADLKISPGDAARLQEVAHQQVTALPETAIVK